MENSLEKESKLSIYFPINYPRSPFRTKDKILYNKHAGHMLRTKLASADEGGVIAGVGALDSPYLVDCCD